MDRFVPGPGIGAAGPLQSRPILPWLAVEPALQCACEEQAHGGARVRLRHAAMETERAAARLLNSGGPLPLGRRQVGKTFPPGHKPGGFLSGGAARAPCQTVSWFISRPLPRTPRALATAGVKTGRSGRVSFSGRGITLDSGPLGQQMLDPPQCPLSASVRPYGRSNCIIWRSHIPQSVGSVLSNASARAMFGALKGGDATWLVRS